MAAAVAMLRRLAPRASSCLTAPAPPACAAQRRCKSGKSGLSHLRDLRVYPSLPTLENSAFPAKYRLPIYPKVPNPAERGIPVQYKHTKELHRMYGEEEVHNKLLLNQFGIVAVHGGRLAPRHFDAVRMYTNRRLREGESFAIYRVDPPHQPVTFRGPGKKLGGGKGKIKDFVTPVKAGRVILEVGGRLLWEEVEPWLSLLAKKLPFEAIAVTPDLLRRLDAEEKRLEEANTNPYTFEWLVRNNIFDCQRHLSPRDRVHFGKFTYHDRTFNKKWNTVRSSRWRHRQ